MDSEAEGHSLVEKRAQRSLTKVWARESLCQHSVDAGKKLGAGGGRAEGEIGQGSVCLCFLAKAGCTQWAAS